MKISTKGIYAIETMIDLAIHSVDGVESIKNISKRRNLSEKYLEQIIGMLRKGGMIESKRGAGGGYYLKKTPEEITVREILDLVESNLVPLECIKEGAECEMDCSKCATRVFWIGLWNGIEDIMQEVTLAKLIAESQRGTKEQEIEYYI